MVMTNNESYNAICEQCNIILTDVILNYFRVIIKRSINFEINSISKFSIIFYNMYRCIISIRMHYLVWFFMQ